MASAPEAAQPGSMTETMPLRSIIGHKPLVDLLRRAVARDRVPQSLLFAGPEGVGKHAVAIALAQAVNCPRRQAQGKEAGDACGECPTCLRIANNQHSDVAVVDQGGEASIKIKMLRERVLEVVGFRPFEARHRVYIIDPADELTIEAQDALLKTLEEPPPAAIFILITAYPDTLLQTVQSRCRRLRFGPLAEAEVARVLSERYGLDNAKARALAAASGGSVSRALDEETGDLGDDRDAALALLAATKDRAIAPRLKAAASLAQHNSKRRDREALGMRLSIVLSLVRDMGVLAAGAPEPLANADLEDALRRLAPAFDGRRLANAFGVIVEAQDALTRNASPKIVADWVAVTI
jgi:DNA polymerase-3 subunit delta'